MPSAPVLQVIYRRIGDILLGWKPLKNSEVKRYKLYGSSVVSGPFLLVKDNIGNHPDKTLYTGKVVTYVKDLDIPIPTNTTYFFKLTFVDISNVESDIANSNIAEVRPPQIEPFFENENEVQNNHNMIWVESRKRWEKLAATDDGKLKVDASFSGTMGNVKVAARPDNTTVEYLLVDSNRRLVVMPDPNAITRIDGYNEASGVLPNVETEIFSYTNTNYFVDNIVCSGTSDAIYRLEIDGNTKEKKRSSWNNRNITFDFSNISRKVVADIKVFATQKEVNNQDFEVSMLGFTFAIV